MVKSPQIALHAAARNPQTAGARNKWRTPLRDVIRSTHRSIIRQIVPYSTIGVTVAGICSVLNAYVKLVKKDPERQRMENLVRPYMRESMGLPPEPGSDAEFREHLRRIYGTGERKQ